MTDPVATPAAVAGSATVDTGTVHGADLAQVIAQAVAAAVTTSMNEVTAKVNQMLQTVSENTKKVSTSDDTDFKASVTGVYDPYDAQRRMHQRLAELDTVTLKVLAQMVEHNDEIFKRSMDHFGSLPPVAPKAAGC